MTEFVVSLSRQVGASCELQPDWRPVLKFWWYACRSGGQTSSVSLTAGFTAKSSGVLPPSSTAATRVVGLLAACTQQSSCAVCNRIVRAAILVGVHVHLHTTAGI
jgi:hypothetical protein